MSPEIIIGETFYFINSRDKWQHSGKKSNIYIYIYISIKQDHIHVLLFFHSMKLMWNTIATVYIGACINKYYKYNLYLMQIIFYKVASKDPFLIFAVNSCLLMLARLRVTPSLHKYRIQGLNGEIQFATVDLGYHSTLVHRFCRRSCISGSSDLNAGMLWEEQVGWWSKPIILSWRDATEIRTAYLKILSSHSRGSSGRSAFKCLHLEWCCRCE